MDNPIKCLVPVKSNRENIKKAVKHTTMDEVYTRRSVVQEFIETHRIIMRLMTEENCPRRDGRKKKLATRSLFINCIHHCHLVVGAQPLEGAHILNSGNTGSAEALGMSVSSSQLSSLHSD